MFNLYRDPRERSAAFFRYDLHARRDTRAERYLFALPLRRDRCASLQDGYRGQVVRMIYLQVHEKARVLGIEERDLEGSVGAHLDRGLEAGRSTGRAEILRAVKRGCEDAGAGEPLPAGGIVTDRDFGFVPADTGGQFENARIDGILFADDGDGVRQNGEAGLGDVT